MMQHIKATAGWKLMTCDYRAFQTTEIIKILQELGLSNKFLWFIIKVYKIKNKLTLDNLTFTRFIIFEAI